MYIKHDAQSKDIERIVKEGIRPGIETGNHIWKCVSNPNLIYLTVSLSEKTGDSAQFFHGWGDVIFVLNDEWARENNGQFLEYFDERISSVTKADLGYWGITERIPHSPFQNDRAYDCIISTKRIPVEALELLVLSRDYYLDRVEQMIPKHMGLYVLTACYHYSHKLIRVKEPAEIRF